MTSHILSGASPFGLSSASAVKTGSYFVSAPARMPNSFAPAKAAPMNATSASAMFAPPTFSTSTEATLDPPYRVGASGEDLFSGNVNYSLPLVSLPGRAGLDLNITLSYNSLVWVKSNNRMQFDPGYYETLTPGFRLGFPEIEGPLTFGSTETFIVTLPSGRRVELRKVTGTTNQYEAIDSSYLYLVVDLVDAAKMTLFTTDGTQFKFEIPPNGYVSRCTQIKDSNGNYITISYKAIGDPGYPLIVTDKVIDTLGREIVFHYDENLHLLAIKQSWQGQDFVWAQFEYGTQAVNPNFGSLGIDGPRNNELIPTITRVLTGDGARHTFVYNLWGQAEDFWLYGEANNPRASLDYVFPAATAPQSDCPRPTQRNDYIANWAGATGNGMVSSYFSFDAANETYGQITDPDGVTHKQLFHITGGKRGLASRTETWHNSALQKFTNLTWISDVSSGRPVRPRVTETQTCDDRNHNGIYESGTDKLSKTTISHDTLATTMKLPATVKQYNEGGQSVYRTTVTSYVTDANYTATTRRILGLPSMEKLYEGDSTTLVAQTEYIYDGLLESGSNYAVAHASAPRQHDAVYGVGFRYRGNLTNAKRYSVVSGAASAPIETKTNFHLTGTVALTKDALDRQTTVFYDDSFLHYGDSSLTPTAVTPNPPTYAYPTKVTSPAEAGYSEGFSSLASYNYNFGGVTRMVDPKAYAANPTSPQTLSVRTYDSKGRPDKAVVWKDGTKYSQTRNVYGNDHNYAESWTTVNNLAEETSVVHLLDGVGRQRIAISEHPGSLGGLKLQYQVFDKMGRVTETSNPTEVDGNWVPAGDDSGYIYSSQAYDWKGRPTLMTNQDLTTRSISYDGCGCAGANVVTRTDEVGRKQKAYYDVHGRMEKVENMKSDGTTVYSTESYSHDVRDLPGEKQIIQGTAGAARSWVTLYDGYGRKWKTKRPAESTHTVYAYNPDNTVMNTTDARGVVTNYTYYNRPLVKEVSYTLPSSPAYPILPTNSTTFEYDENGNRKKMTQKLPPPNSTVVWGETTYDYDELNRLTSEQKTFNELPGSYTLNYSYNLKGQVGAIGFVSSNRSQDNFTTSYAFNKIGGVTAVTGSAFLGFTTYAGDLKYRAWGALKSLSYGNGGWETSTFNGNLQLTSYQLHAPNTVSSPSPPVTTIANRMGATYQYFADGRIKSADSTEDSRFNRAYTYDNVGRVETDITPGGGSAYSHSFKYNEWGQVTERSGKVWSMDDNSIISFNNNTGRHVDWDYDEAGNLVNDDVNTYEYDAAGRSGSVKQIGQSDSSRAWHDGDGLLVKANPYSSKHEYLIRASALGGKVIAVLKGAAAFSNSCGYAPVGAKCEGNLYLGDRVLASGQIGFLNANGLPTSYSLQWEHIKPIAGSEAVTMASSDQQSQLNYTYFRKAEPDSGGINVGLSDPTVPPTYTPDYEIPGYSSSGGTGAPGTPVILVDGVLMDADLARSLLSLGAAEIDWKHTSYTAAIQLGVFGHWESEEAEEKQHKWRLVDDTERPGEKIWQLESSTKDRFVIDSLGLTPSFGNFGTQGGKQKDDKVSSVVSEPLLIKDGAGRSCKPSGN